MRWWVLVLVVGCTNQLTLDEFEDQYTERFCEWRARCGLYGAVAECVERAGFAGDTTADVRGAVGAGKVDFDSSAARDCLDGFDTVACHHRTPLLACANVFHGRLHLGDACALDVECDTWNCDFTTCPADGCCAGTCAQPSVRAMVGEPCYGDADCAPELQCHFEPGPFVPGQAGACQPLPGTGEPCDFECLEQSDTCREDTHLCAHGAVTGERCDTNFDCGELYECSVDNACVLGQPWYSPIGATCNENVDCASGTCDGVCVEAPVCY